MRLSLALLVFVVGCGRPEPPSPEEGLALATETYREHFADGIDPGLFGATVIRRGGYFIELHPPYTRTADGQLNVYSVPQPRAGEALTPLEKARTARQAGGPPLTDSSVVARLARLIEAFEAAGLHEASTALDGQSAGFLVTPYDVLSYHSAGIDPDTVRGNSTHRQLIAPGWMYSRRRNSHDGT